MKTEKLNFTTKLAYGSGDMGPAITANILVFFLLYFFTNVAGLPPGLAGSILAIGKIGDAINDPIAGILSDRTKTKWGRRIPWMLGATIPLAIVMILLFTPPIALGSDVINFIYFFIFFRFISINIIVNKIIILYIVIFINKYFIMRFNIIKNNVKDIIR